MAPQDDSSIDFAVHSSCLSSQFRSHNKSFCFDLCCGPMASVHFPNDTHASCVGFVSSFADMLCHSVIVGVSLLWFGARVPCWWSVSLSLWLRLEWYDFVIAPRFPSYASNDVILLPTLHYPAKCLYPAGSTQPCDQDGMARRMVSYIHVRTVVPAVPDWDLVPVHTTTPPPFYRSLFVHTTNTIRYAPGPAQDGILHCF